MARKRPGTVGVEGGLRLGLLGFGRGTVSSPGLPAQKALDCQLQPPSSPAQQLTSPGRPMHRFKASPVPGTTALPGPLPAHRAWAGFG